MVVRFTIIKVRGMVLGVARVRQNGMEFKVSDEMHETCIFSIFSFGGNSSYCGN